MIIRKRTALVPTRRSGYRKVHQTPIGKSWSPRYAGALAATRELHKPVRRILRADGNYHIRVLEKEVAGWIEEWGATITSNHPWTGMTVGTSCVAGTNAPTLVTFESDRVLKISHICTNDGGMCIVNPKVNFLTGEGEEPINCGNLSGFSAKIYFESIAPNTMTTECESDPDYSYIWTYAYYVILYIRAVDLSSYLESYYGFTASYLCNYYGTGWNGVNCSSWANFKAKIGQWSDMPLYPGDPERWGNSNYEVWKVTIWSYLDCGSTGTPPTLPNMSSVFYLDDIELY